MKVMLTGFTGTLAPYIYRALIADGHEVVLWDRYEVLPDDKVAVKTFIETHQPDVFFHIATGPETWLKTIIEVIKPKRIPLVFTSTESVFDETQAGPFTVTTPPLATGDYGQYKIACEKLIAAHYPENTYVVRLGWQIAMEPLKNNMLNYLVTAKSVEASTEWVLSTSFMPDTAQALIKLINDQPPGLYHLDGNSENWDFYTLVCTLKAAFDLPIEVIKTDHFKRNNRLLSDVKLVNSIQERLTAMQKGDIS